MAALSQWTPNAGANYAAVDDPTQDDDATYVAATTSGQVDYYKNASMGWTPASIIGVQVESVAKIDSGTQAWRNRLKDSGGTDRNGAAKTATTAYVKTEDFYGRNPATGCRLVKGQHRGLGVRRGVCLMADTIRVTTSSLVVAETSSPASETQTRLSNVRLMIISGVTDLPMALPTGRRTVINT